MNKANYPDSFLTRIMEQLRQRRSLDLNGYRPSMLERRLSARLEKVGVGAPSDYLILLEEDPKEIDLLIDALMIRVSAFFRNPIVWEILAQSFLPELILRKRRSGNHEIRVWSVGCATGEEAYSMAVLICEALGNELPQWTPYVFSTDISREALRTAEAGEYGRQAFQSTKLGLIDRHFSVTKDGYRVSSSIRRMVRFSPDDLTSTSRVAPVDSVFGSFDLVLCRNVLIYYSADLRKRILDKLYRSLDNRGWMVFGESEWLDTGAEPRLIAVDGKNRIYRKPE